MATNQQRRDAARRQVRRQAEQRRAQDRRRHRATLIASGVGLAVLIALVVAYLVTTSGEDSARSSGSPTAGTNATAARGHCAFPAGGSAARAVVPPAVTAPTTGTARATVTTNRGTMVFTLDRAAAPCTVANFVSLGHQHYFDATSCHRLTTSGIYVLQCGDPTGSGTGGPGYTIPDELTGSETYHRGVLAMAKTAAPNSGGSQFFIVYKDTALPPNYTVFGTVTTGLDTIDKVAAAGVSGGNGDGRPALPITLQQVTVS